MQDTLTFGLVTDSHYAQKETRNNKFYKQSVVKMKEFVEVMNQEKVDFIIHLGDFKDEDKNRKEEDTLHYLNELEAVYNEFKGPKYHCIGNHDVDSIKKEQFLAQVTNTGIPKGESYYSFDCNGFHLVVLDASFYEDGRDHFFKEGGDFQDSHIPEKERSWLKEDLQNTDLPTIIFCHYLFFESRKWGYYFQVGEHEAVRELLEKSGKVIAVFHGHIHHEQYQKINDIHYIVHSAMVDGDGIENNSFSKVSIGMGKIRMKGFKLASDREFDYII